MSYSQLRLRAYKSRGSCCGSSVSEYNSNIVISAAIGSGNTKMDYGGAVLLKWATDGGRMCGNLETRRTIVFGSSHMDETARAAESDVVRRPRSWSSSSSSSLSLETLFIRLAHVHGRIHSFSEVTSKTAVHGGDILNGVYMSTVQQ